MSISRLHPDGNPQPNPVTASDEEMAQVRRRMEQYRLRVLNDNARDGSFPLLLATISFAALMINQAGVAQVVPWFLAVLAVLAARFTVLMRYFSAPEEPHNKLIYTHIGLLVTLGCLYGIVPVSFARTDLSMLAISNLWLAGLSFSLLLSQGIVIGVGVAFAVPAMIPLLGIYLLSGDLVQTLLCLGNVLLYAFFFAVVSRTRNTLLDEVAHRARYEQLTAHYQQERERGEQLIMNLSDEVERRKKAEVELRKARDAAETKSNEDHLTGLSNRRVFDKVLAREWFRGMRNNKPLALVLCDIDSFRAYNDLYGMHAGDQCLLRVSTAIADHVKRAGDFAARYGGEEFAIVLPDTTEFSAVEIAENMRAAIYDKTILHAGSTTDRVVTASFGVATVVPRESARHGELIQAADFALSRAKRGGGNCVFAIDGPVNYDNNSIE